MSKVMKSIIVCAISLVAATSTPSRAYSQVTPDTESGSGALTRRSQSGPRIGFITFTGAVSDRRQQAGLEPIMTLFGWQFERQIVSSNGGTQALIEVIPLVGGVEQGELNLSVAWLAGLRGRSGLEVGAGPNITWNRASETFSTSMQVAGGASIPVGDFFVPINMAVGVAQGGPRFSVLVGWTVGS